MGPSKTRSTSRDFVEFESVNFLLYLQRKTENHVRTGSLAPIFQFSSHSSWITACKWHSRSHFHLVSASYDGKVMLWDLRTAVWFDYL